MAADAHPWTPPPPASSKAPGGPCSNGPTTCPTTQADTLRKLRRRGGAVWRAYSLKEAFRAIFSRDLAIDEAEELIDRWISRASRSRLEPFTKAAKTIRLHRDGILAALWLGINNGRAEA